MAIAGVEARFRDAASVFGDDGEGDLFTVDQVREILERFDEWVQVVGNDDVDGFMESGEEE